MDAIAKRHAALELLETTGIWKSNYAPPGVKLLWRLGVACPPPHMASFSGTALVAGLYFAVGWGLCMWLFFWSKRPLPITSALLLSIIVGIFFGLFMASYYAFGRRKHQLPFWNDFHPVPESTFNS